MFICLLIYQYRNQILMEQIISEPLLLYIACFFYSIIFLIVYLPHFRHQDNLIILVGSIGLAIHTISLVMRWQRVGHGPFINLYEILSSNVWSLMFCYLLFMAFARQYRAVGRFLVPVLAVLMAWLLLTTPTDTYLPPTYHTIWLYFHVFSGKFFLGFLLLAVALAFYGVVQQRRNTEELPAQAIQLLSYQFLAFAFCFESLMLFFGAIWAQDAWGRYWAWDPLETWAFLTWLSVLFVLHWRSKSTRYDIYAVMISGCFILAFLTFFGVPFISTAPHKGMI